MKLKQLIRLPLLLAVILIFGCSTAKQPPNENHMLMESLSQAGFVIEESERGVIVYLPSVFFTTNSSTLSQDAKDKLKVIAKIANRQEFLHRKISVEGHTDSTGSQKYNLNLSKTRAQNVTKMFMIDRVNRSRINTLGFGESKPRVPKNALNNAAARATNRRVEVVIHNPNQD